MGCIWGKIVGKLTDSLVGGIAGVNPYMGTLGTVGLARYAIQVALAYELDARQIPSNWTTGYWLKDSTGPGQPAGDIYGTEVFEVSIRPPMLRLILAQYQPPRLCPIVPRRH